MPLIQWIMQNLQPTNFGVVADGVALVQKLMQVVAAGGATISGVSDSFVIKIGKGVVIDGFATVETELNVTTTGGVELSGAAELEFNAVLRKILPYSVGDTVYLSDGQQYTILAFYWDLDMELTYQIENFATTSWVPVSLLYPDRSIYLNNQLSIIDQNIQSLSM